MKERKKIYALVAGLCVFIAGALFLCGRSEAALGSDGVVVRQSHTEGATETAESQSEILVHVCGAVAKEGVIRLCGGSRISDAIEAAGGFAEDADRDYYNLARLLTDGEQIKVPTLAEGSSLEAEEKKKNDGLVDINRADMEELITLPGIGESRAADIIEYREANGPFAEIEDIMKVPGIKESAFSKIKSRIKTGD